MGELDHGIEVACEAFRRFLQAYPSFRFGQLVVVISNATPVFPSDLTDQQFVEGINSRLGGASIVVLPHPLELSGERRKLIESIRTIRRMRPNWQFGQIVVNVASWAGVNIWDLTEEEAVKATDRYVEVMTQNDKL